MEGEQQREIASGLHEGDVAAWQALYDAYARPLWGLVARWMGPSSTDIADVVQETFMAAARGATGYDPKRASLWLWLCGIARRHAAQHYRTQARHARVRAPESVGAADPRASRWLENREDSPDGAVASVEQAARVRAALLVLPGEYEVLLTEKYVDGASVAELSRRHGTSEMAVRSKLARARRAFRRVYERTSRGSARDCGGGPV